MRQAELMRRWDDHLAGGNRVVAVAIAAIQRHTAVPVMTARGDMDADLSADLRIDGRHRFEIAGELAQLVGLPGADDDDVNASIIESLAACGTIRELVQELLVQRREVIELVASS